MVEDGTLHYILRKDILFLNNSLGYAFSPDWFPSMCFIGDGECMHKLYFCCSVWAHLWMAVEMKVWRHAHGATKKAKLFLNAVKSFEGFNVLVRLVRRLTMAAEESQTVCPTQSWHHVMCSHVGIGAPGFLHPCLCRPLVSSWIWVACRLLSPEAKGRERSAT